MKSRAFYVSEITSCGLDFVEPICLQDSVLRKSWKRRGRKEKKRWGGTKNKQTRIEWPIRARSLSFDCTFSPLFGAANEKLGVSEIVKLRKKRGSKEGMRGEGKKRLKLITLLPRKDTAYYGRRSWTGYNIFEVNCVSGFSRAAMIISRPSRGRSKSKSKRKKKKEKEPI